jgi:hypothetical protein
MTYIAKYSKQVTLSGMSSRLALILPVVLLSFTACNPMLRTKTSSDRLHPIMAQLEAEHASNGVALVSKGFHQGWRETPEPGFEPAHAALYAEPNGFLVLAVLGDRAIGNSADGFNQRTWESGDVFEIFIQTDPDTYYECHVTPENQHLFLKWTSESIKNGAFEEALISDRDFLNSQTHLHPEKNYWTVLARIPYAKLGIAPGAKPLDLKVAFARYDTGSTEKPILSATPDFPEALYHNRSVWHKFQLPE